MKKTRFDRVPPHPAEVWSHAWSRFISREGVTPEDATKVADAAVKAYLKRFNQPTASPEQKGAQ